MAESEGGLRESVLAVAPSLAEAVGPMRLPAPASLVEPRTLVISALAVALALAASLAAQLLTRLIALVTNLVFHAQASTAVRGPADHQLGLWVVLVPAAGGLLVGLMARYGSAAIRGHGIPEAMEQVLTNESRVPPRITFLKPLSAAVAIGTGGPFGAEGPIIATGGALGSLVGQLLLTTAAERKVLLAAGAAAGMAATFGSPISAVILAVELLLFELRPRSVIPVALASATAAGVRDALVGSAPVFAMPTVAAPSLGALAAYIVIGGVTGLLAIAVTRLVYGIEGSFERLPLHWMWWPALGGLAVGLTGYFVPAVLGVGYTNIEDLVAGRLAPAAALSLATAKLIAWSISLGSGTSGGTLAPLFTIGGGFGTILGAGLASLFPALGIDPRVAAVVAMAAIFAGASRAVLASVLFAFEATAQTGVLLPLLAGCTTAYLVSCLLMRHTIMTEKIARRGIRVPSEYAADYLDQVPVEAAMSRPVVSLRAAEPLGTIRSWLATGVREAQHQGFPVTDAQGGLVGVLTRRDLLDPCQPEAVLVGSLVRRPPIVVQAGHSLREAADHMVREGVGRLVVVDAQDASRPIGFLTRSDLLEAHSRRLDEQHRSERAIRFGGQGAGQEPLGS